MRRQGYQRKGTRGSGQAGRVRIVGGRWRGRRIQVEVSAGLRPTPERTRETLFNWLQADIRGARVLDPFAGSGALGFEALSRGAASVVMIEQAARVFARLRATRQELEAHGCELIRSDALRWLGRADQPFDLVLLDPPFGHELARATLDRLRERGLVRPGGLIYCETGARETPPWSGWPGMKVLRQTRAGDSQAMLLQTPEQEAAPSVVSTLADDGTSTPQEPV